MYLAADSSLVFFFFNDTATTEIYTLSLHDALPISAGRRDRRAVGAHRGRHCAPSGPDSRVRRPRRLEHRLPLLRSLAGLASGDRKSTRLNSSHGYISYAVFCLKKKKETMLRTRRSCTLLLTRL